MLLLFISDVVKGVQVHHPCPCCWHPCNKWSLSCWWGCLSFCVGVPLWAILWWQLLGNLSICSAGSLVYWLVVLSFVLLLDLTIVVVQSNNQLMITILCSHHCCYCFFFYHHCSCWTQRMKLLLLWWSFCLWHSRSRQFVWNEPHCFDRSLISMALLVLARPCPLWTWVFCKAGSRRRRWRLPVGGSLLPMLVFLLLFAAVA